MEMPRPSIAATGSSLCTYYLAYHSDTMEKICGLPTLTLERLVKQTFTFHYPSTHKKYRIKRRSFQTDLFCVFFLMLAIIRTLAFLTWIFQSQTTDFNVLKRVRSNQIVYYKLFRYQILCKCKKQYQWCIRISNHKSPIFQLLLFK